MDAEIVDSAGNVVAGSSLGFHLGGDWANEAMTVLPAQDAYASVGTWLAVESERDIFPEDTTQVYTISANPDGVSTPLAVSEPINGSYLVPSGILQDGHRFYWTATTTGTSAGAAATVRTPVHAFTATTAKINNRCAAALQGVAEASSLSRADYESTCQGDDSQDPGVVADADDLGVDFSDDTAATASLAVARSAGAIHSTYGTATGHAPAYNWKSVMRGKFYYDGTSAWSKKKHRGKVGYQRCDDDGSYGLGVAVGVKACGNYSPKGKDILYETVKVDYVFRGSPVSYTQSFHLTVTKSGKKTGGKGGRFLMEMAFKRNQLLVRISVSVIIVVVVLLATAIFPGLGTIVAMVALLIAPLRRDKVLLRVTIVAGIFALVISLFVLYSVFAPMGVSYTFN
ncbi:hypothetical protein WDV91_00320 [Curtobacterium flaccumfaciens pv. flaccumfaciens]